MPADSFSDTLGSLVMGTGNDNNTWGDNCNNDVFAIFEDAIAGKLSSSVTGGTTDLSTSPPPNGPSAARYAFLTFSGVLSADQTVKVPNLTKKWTVFNNTTGSFDFYMKTPVGTSILIPQGMHCDVWCDGSDNLRRLAARTGEIFSFAGTTAPSGSMECDGTALSRTGKGLELFGKISTTWGVGNGATTFNIPQLNNNGYFLRSRTGSVTVGTFQAHGLASHTHTGSVTVNSTGTASGTSGATAVDHTHPFSWSGSGTTTGQSADHTHSYNEGVAGAQKPSSGGTSPFDHSTSSNTGTSSQDHTHNFSYSGSGTTSTNGASTSHTHSISVSVSASGSGSFTSDANAGAATETRPYAATVMMCIWL